MEGVSGTTDDAADRSRERCSGTRDFEGRKQLFEDEDDDDSPLRSILEDPDQYATNQNASAITLAPIELDDSSDDEIVCVAGSNPKRGYQTDAVEFSVNTQSEERVWTDKETFTLIRTVFFFGCLKTEDDDPWGQIKKRDGRISPDSHDTNRGGPHQTNLMVHGAFSEGMRNNKIRNGLEGG